jgi:hypothetical protein
VIDLDTVTVACCDNGDVQMRVTLDDEPGCSMLALRVATWDEHDENGNPPADNWDADDHAALDLDEMRALHARLGEAIAQVEAHDAALMADDAADDDTDGM